MYVCVSAQYCVAVDCAPGYADAAALLDALKAATPRIQHCARAAALTAVRPTHSHTLTHTLSHSLIHTHTHSLSLSVCL